MYPMAKLNGAFRILYIILVVFNLTVQYPIFGRFVIIAENITRSKDPDISVGRK